MKLFYTIIILVILWVSAYVLLTSEWGIRQTDRVLNAQDNIYAQERLQYQGKPLKCAGCGVMITDNNIYMSANDIAICTKCVAEAKADPIISKKIAHGQEQANREVENIRKNGIYDPETKSYTLITFGSK